MVKWWKYSKRKYSLKMWALFIALILWWIVFLMDMISARGLTMSTLSDTDSVRIFKIRGVTASVTKSRSDPALSKDAFDQYLDACGCFAIREIELCLECPALYDSGDDRRAYKEDTMQTGQKTNDIQ